MRRSLILLLLLLLSARAAAEERTVDISSVKRLLVVLKDAKGHYFAIVPGQVGGEVAEVNWLFYGDAKSFHHLRHPKQSGVQASDFFYWNIWDPDYKDPEGSMIFWQKGKYELGCGEQKIPYQQLPEAEAKAIIESAKFYGPTLDRQEYAFARDDAGIYYYVDRAYGDDARDFHLWVGPRGALKLMKMKNVVSDSAGDIFATAKGQLRLVLGDGNAVWVKGKKRTSLTWLPLEDNLALIYGALGVYAKTPLGLPCDDVAPVQ